MIKKYILVAGALVGMQIQGFADVNSYETLCTNVVAALTNKRILVSPGFTNQLNDCLRGVDVRQRSLAELVLSISLFDMFETSQMNEYDEGCRLCTNVLYSVDLPERSWQKSVASLIYSSALHMDGKRERALAVCCAALSTHLASPTTDVERAVWSAMSRVEGDAAEFDITNSLKLAAALSVLSERRPLEWGAYTNGLPARAIQILLGETKEP